MSVTKEQLDEYLKAYQEGKPIISDEEVWCTIHYRDIHNDMYEVSNYGRIRRKDTLKLMCPNVRGNGYAYVRLSLNECGKSRIFTIHRLVAFHFCEGYCEKTTNIVNHKDGNKLNNFYVNLEWCTQKHNSQHAVDTGLREIRYGDDSNRHFVSSALVERICQMLVEYDGSIKPILTILKTEGIYCTFGIIESIKQKETWIHISDKYFNKGYFDELKNNDIRTICENIKKYNGNRKNIMKHTKLKSVKLNEKMLNDIIEKQRYKNISDEYFDKDAYCKKKFFSENDVRRICELLIKYKGDVKMVFNNLNDSIPNATIDRISDIKHKGSYENISNEYFERGEFNQICVEDLDFIRELLMTKTISYSPLKLYEILNHEKYPRLTISVIGMISRCSHDVYNQSNKMQIEKFIKNKENGVTAPISKETLSKLIASYSSGFSDISDESYDALLEEYLKKHGESLRPFLRQSQTESIADIVGTLQKSHGVTTPMRPGQTTYDDWRKKHNFKSLTFVAQPKFDGCSVAYDLKEKRFFTRGDMDNGESVDVTDLFNKHDLNEKNLDGYDAIKFEAILSKQVFNELFSNEYKRPRDVVAAAIHSRDTEVSKYITLIPLRKIKNKKLYLSETLKELSLLGTAGTTEYSSIQNFIDDLLANNASQYFMFQTYECDGVVISNIDNVSNEVLIEEIAIKILNLQKKTKLKKVIFSMGKSGRVTPVAIVEPVKFDTVTVSNISLENLNRMTELRLRDGDTVNIMYNIRPYLLSSDHDGGHEIPIPDRCPICGYKLTRLGPELVGCENPNCRGNEIGSIVRYCQNMKMYGISTSTVETLYDAGMLKTISDLYHLKAEDISKLDRFGNISAANIVRSIRKASTNVNPLRWLSSLPCRNIGLKTWMLIQKGAFEDDNLRLGNILKEVCKQETPNMFIEELCKPVFGVDDLTLNAIRVGVTYAWKDIREMIKYITFTALTPMKSSKGTVVLSGTRDRLLIEYLESVGYEVSDSFKSDAKYVIVPNLNFTSSKTKKAHEKGIPVIGVESALKLS